VVPFDLYPRVPFVVTLTKPAQQRIAADTLRFAAHAAMLVHSFSQSGEWYQDYAVFVALMGENAAEYAIISLGTRSVVSLHLAWVRGNAIYLSK